MVRRSSQRRGDVVAVERSLASQAAAAGCSDDDDWSSVAGVELGFIGFYRRTVKDVYRYVLPRCGVTRH